MQVKIHSRKSVEALLRVGFPKNTAVISFYDTDLQRIDKNYNPVDYSDATDNVFYISLLDIDIDILGDYGLTYDTYFPEVDKLAQFIYDTKEKDMDIICQCEYGQSRSAGCDSAILQHFYSNGISVFADYRYYPNQVVYHKIFDALNKVKE